MAIQESAVPVSKITLHVEIEIHKSGFPLQRQFSFSLSLDELDGKWGGVRAWFAVYSALARSLRECGVHISRFPLVRYQQVENPEGITQRQITHIGPPHPVARLQEIEPRSEEEAEEPITYEIVMSRHIDLIANDDETRFRFVDDLSVRTGNYDEVLVAEWRVLFPIAAEEDVEVFSAFVSGDAFGAYHEILSDELDVSEVGELTLRKRAEAKGEVEAAILSMLGLPFLGSDMRQCLESALFS